MPLAFPHRWKNKLSGSEVKVLPWFQPIGSDSRFDFKGLLKECMPELSGDVMAEFEVYSGLVMQVGWQLLTDKNVWWCMPMSVKDQFEDLGIWEGPDPESIYDKIIENKKKEEEK